MSPIFKNVVKEILKDIVQKLQQQLITAQNASQDAHNNATHSETVAENKYDTLALEAAYLAHGQSIRIKELYAAIAEYQNLPLPQHRNCVQMGNLVEIARANGKQQRVFIGPCHGGLKLGDSRGDILLITLATPLAQAIIGKQRGDEVELLVAAKSQQLIISEIY